MADDRSDDILDNNVDEVKERIRDAVDVDLTELLEAEKDGRDRKTVKEFIESRISSGDDEDSEEEEEVDEVVKAVEEETAGGIFGSYSSSSVFAGGLLLGLLVGLVSMGVVSGIGPSGEEVSSAEAQSTVEQLLNGTGEVSELEERHGLYYFNVTSTVNTGNETAEQSQSFYMTKDAEIIFPTQLLGQPSYIDVDQALSQLEESQNQQPEEPVEPNATSDSTPQ